MYGRTKAGGYDAIQETSADQPATGSTSTNSLNTLSFDGSGDGFILGKDLSHKNLNVFVLLKGHGFVIANNASDRFLYVDTGSGEDYGDINGVITTSNINISSYSKGAYQIHEFSLNSGVLTVRVNGTQEYQRANTSGKLQN